GVKRPIIGASELHQIDAGEVARRVVEEHVLAARVRSINATTIRASVPLVDGRIVLHARIAAVPRTIGHTIHDLASRVGRAGMLRIGDLVASTIHVLLPYSHGA